MLAPGPGSERVEQRKGYTVRIRGAGGLVKHEYRCSVHGVFDARVDARAVPDEMPCPGLEMDGVCGLTSPWAGSRCGIGWAAGECRS